MRVVEVLPPGTWRLVRLLHDDGRIEFLTGRTDALEEQRGQRVPHPTAPGYPHIGGLGRPSVLLDAGPNVVVAAALRLAHKGVFLDEDTGFAYATSFDGLESVLAALVDGRLRAKDGVVEGLFSFAPFDGFVSLVAHGATAAAEHQGALTPA